ncbi:MAG: hypothetical protein Q8K58_11875 [Acidimicrobiales bacterium]|nr:hypothetical protein [Acidimicrobiales bacterium]
MAARTTAEPGNEPTYPEPEPELHRADLDEHRLLARGQAAPRPAGAPGSLDWRQTVGGALVGLGLLATAIAWYGVSGTLDPGEQMPYISSGGFGGAALIALGVTLLVGFEHVRDRAALRDLLDELDLLRTRLEALDRDVNTWASASAKSAPNGAGRAAARSPRRSSKP